MRTYEEFFERATGRAPFPYQKELARVLPAILSVPTGAGKTAAVLLAWLWRRCFAEQSTRSLTPRRLVYCLPMRVLVEQTRDCARQWLQALDLYASGAPGDHPAGRVAVHVMMGGDLEVDWDQWPDRDQILIGTQDMLLSRALNRGYALSRFRWPMQFGLLNQDCLWILDEVQLMGDGLGTTAQLQALRRKLGTFGEVQSVWMSATMRSEWLDTVDFDLSQDGPGALAISEEDRAHPVLQPRLGAIKTLRRTSFEATKDCAAEAELVLSEHEAPTLTLVVVNTVDRARDLFVALRKKRPAAELVLLHSRFRQQDRDRQLARLLKEPGPSGTVVVSTQVVEAGVDVSAKLLITDLAPWSSLVQRFGRCNRQGEFNKSREARVFWISPPNLKDDKQLKPEPYEAEELREAAKRLLELTDVGPASLPPFTAAMSFKHVLRRKDLVELFDTTPDLAGADIDVSRFIREVNDRQVQVFWRDLDEGGPSDQEPEPRREELCTVPIRKLDLSKQPAWRWDHLERRWDKAKTVFPGLVLLLRCNDGGYDSELGWTGKPGRVEPVVPSGWGSEADANDRDPLAERRSWQTLAEHSDRVVSALGELLACAPELGSQVREAVEGAARWHDCGKSHPVFQEAMPEGRPAGILAKSAQSMKRYGRPGFRHELASATAMLALGRSDLEAYLAAAHHGKVRLSIRSLPHERHPLGAPDSRFARGVWEGDRLPAADLGGGVVLPETTLSLRYMELGEDEQTGPSWLARMLALRDSPELGPFRLGFLEALLRVADWRASAGSGEVRVATGSATQKQGEQES